MKRVESIIINVIVISLTLFSVLFIISGLTQYGADYPFMYKHAETLLSKGFITKDILRMHEDFDFMIPQWLFVLIIYKLQTIFSNKAVTIFMVIVLSLCAALLYKTVSILLKDTKKAFLFTAIIVPIYLVFYSSIRPYNVTILLGLCELYLLELGICKGFKSWTYPLIALISILQINFHNSLWVVLLLINLCYVIQPVILLVLKKDSYPLKPILIITGISLISGLVNPYGLSYITYIFTSLVSIRPLKVIITEIRPPESLWLYTNIIFLVIDLFVTVKYAIKYKKLPDLRFLFLTIGFAVLSLSAARNLQFFLMFGQLLLASIIGTEHTEKGKVCYPTILVCYAAVVFSISYMLICSSNEKYYMNREVEIAAHTLKEIGVPEDTRIFTTANAGSAIIYEGYKPYYDCMAELYGIANNHKKDVATEMASTVAMNTDEFRKFLDSYEFEYSVLHDPGYAKKFDQLSEWECIRNVNGGWIYHRKDNRGAHE